ncbi:MAG: hypothetical protein LBK72_00465 [Bifidobacteriaceae bacterium]|jgi:hypothetical protein|nr:hypothetical protein [Bifidobacteriaceae bacterium]
MQDDERYMIAADGTRITVDEFDRLFDEGEEDILQYFDMANVRSPGRELRTVAVDLPAHVFDALAGQAATAGVAVEDLIASCATEMAGSTAK